MFNSIRITLLFLVALICGTGTAVFVADARPVAKKQTADSTAKKKAQKKAKSKKTAAKKVRRKVLTATKIGGRAHVPKRLLGPSWKQIGSTTTPTTTPASPAPLTTRPTYTTPATTTPTPPTPTRALGVSLRDGGLPWRLDPSQISITVGTYSVQMQNFGEDPHDLKVLRDSDGIVIASYPVKPPGEAGLPSLETKQIDLSSAGTYTLFCSLPGHFANGMHSTLTVTSD